MIYWFTGQPGAGKTTLAIALQQQLRAAGHPVVHLDGEFLREIMDNRDYGEAGRIANIRAGQRLAAKLQEEGIWVVAAFVSPYRALREAFKSRGDVVEVYVHTTEIRGRERFFVAGYEPPLADFVDMDTTEVPVESCVARLISVTSGSPLRSSGRQRPIP
ncbi:MAG: adenylyl-sulfate kinase [Nitrospira sp.]|nr:adenylyl-sulfate kinase [Nitrospira sp.]